MATTTDSTVPNADLEHTRGGVTTRDAMDAGVPMTPGQPDEPIGPEDALGPGPKRGDYSERLDSGPHLVTEVIPEDERRTMAEQLAGKKGDVNVALGDVPRTRLVPASGVASDIGDAPGKGGVSTPQAVEGQAALAGDASADPTPARDSA